MKSPKKIVRRFRDAIRGVFVSKEYAEQNPETTVGESVKPPTEPPTR